MVVSYELKDDKDLLEIEEQLAGANNLNDYLDRTIARYGDLQAITDEHANVSLTYNELSQNISNLASAFQAYGIKKGDFVCLFTENNGRFAEFDLAILKCGAIDVLRGSSATFEDLSYIIANCEPRAIVLRDLKTFNKMKPAIENSGAKFVVLMFNEPNDDTKNFKIPVHSYHELIETGKAHAFSPVSVFLTDPCTMLYTSGTTGLPKGVLLNHKNFLVQLRGSHCGFLSQPHEKTLQILPIWHAYERMGQYYYLTRACHLHFTTLLDLKKDMLKYQIDTMMSVPRIWEALRLGIYQKLKQTSVLAYYLFKFAVQTSVIYKIHKMYSEQRLTNKKTPYHTLSRVYHKIARTFLKPLHVLFTNTLYKKVKEAAGLKNIRATVSGGGALSMKDELFYDAIGINVRIGYGLTETAPVVALRSLKDKNYLGSVGKPLVGAQFMIVDPKTRQELGAFQKGLIMVKGEQVMDGYFKDEEATKKVLSPDGWFETGDLGWVTNNDVLVIVGRMKETIVLSNGENVEPVPIEEAILESPYINQIVLVGQDKSSVGALIVPSEDAFKKCGILAKQLQKGKNLTIKNPNLRELIKHELNSYIKNKAGLRACERVKSFEVLNESFTSENGLLSQTAKIKRNKVFEKYNDIISKMFVSK